MSFKSTINNLERNYDKKVIVKMSDMQKSFKSLPKNYKNLTIYEVFIKKFSPINIALTVLNAGTVNKELYMTRGHIHKKPSPEFYILLQGSALLLIQKSSEVKTIKLKKEQITFVPENYAHRLINIGNKKLKVLTVYHKNSKPNYNVKFKKRFFKNKKIRLALKEKFE